MGYYINPPDVMKEEFLKRKGLPLTRLAAKNFTHKQALQWGGCIVVLVINGPFTAAGIAFSQGELEAFRDNVNDTRPKSFYLVQLGDLVDYLPKEIYVKLVAEALT
jgi:hypothetical protein